MISDPKISVQKVYIKKFIYFQCENDQMKNFGIWGPLNKHLTIELNGQMTDDQTTKK